MSFVRMSGGARPDFSPSPLQKVDDRSELAGVADHWCFYWPLERSPKITPEFGVFSAGFEGGDVGSFYCWNQYSDEWSRVSNVSLSKHCAVDFESAMRKQVALEMDLVDALYDSANFKVNIANVALPCLGPVK